MPIPERPAWLLRQENGAIAEARTRAFLLDRFWILERSVDVDGADFIIQRRITTRSLLDRSPPRLGFVQAKYYQDKRTTQHVHREYVLDNDGRPRSEFFVVCHSGVEDCASAYFLTASVINERFKLTSQSHSKPDRFELPGAKVMEREHQILDRARILNLIEQTLLNADFLNNRIFMSWALPSIDKGGPIRGEYLEPIDNWFGSIPEEFDKLRGKARRSLWQVQEACDLLHEISTADDPLVALGKAEELDHEFEGSITIDRVFDRDFFEVVRHHRKRHDELRAAGLLGAHAALRRILKERVVSDIAPRMPLSADCVYVATLQYIPSTLDPVHIESGFESGEEMTLPTERWGREECVMPMGILGHSDDTVRFFILPGRYGYGSPGAPKDSPDNRGWEEKLSPRAEDLVGTVMTAILAKLFGDENEL